MLGLRSSAKFDLAIKSRLKGEGLSTNLPTLTQIYQSEKPFYRSLKPSHQIEI